MICRLVNAKPLNELMLLYFDSDHPRNKFWEILIKICFHEKCFRVIVPMATNISNANPSV